METEIRSRKIDSAGMFGIEKTSLPESRHIQVLDRPHPFGGHCLGGVRPWPVHRARLARSLLTDSHD